MSKSVLLKDAVSFSQAAALFGFELTRALPEILQTSLPSIEQIESELGGFSE
jgi:hypothetical protein